MRRWQSGIAMAAVCIGSSGAWAQAPGQETNSVNVEEEIAAASKAPVKPVFPADRPFYDAIQASKNEMREKIGLEWALAYTAIGQMTSGGIKNNAAAEGTLNFFALWKFIRDANEIDALGMGFQFEQRRNYTGETFTEMTADLGTLWSPNDSTSDDYCQIKQLWFGHRLAEGKITYVIGKLDPGGYIDKNRFAGSGNTQYFAQPFATNPARAFPSNGLGATIRIAPVDWVHFDAVVSDGDADSNHDPFSTWEGNLFAGGEVVFSPTIDGLGQGNYRLLLWNRDSEGGDSTGYALNIDQNLGESFGVFLRYGGNDGDLRPIKHLVAAGLSFLTPFNRPDDQAGVAIAWTHPTDDDLRDEYSGEAYYRIRLTEGIEFSLGAQLIVHPSAADRDVEGVYGARLRLVY